MARVAATGPAYMQQRYYDPLVGRVLSVDPIGASSEGCNFNRYWYANNDPYYFVDLDGKMPTGGLEPAEPCEDESCETTPVPTLPPVVAEAQAPLNLPGLVEFTEANGNKIYIHPSYLGKAIAGRETGYPYNYFDEGKESRRCYLACVAKDLTIGTATDLGTGRVLKGVASKPGKPAGLLRHFIKNVGLPAFKALGPLASFGQMMFSTAPTCAEKCAHPE